MGGPSEEPGRVGRGGKGGESLSEGREGSRGPPERVSCGISGELGSADWSLRSLCVYSLVCCVVVLFFVVVSFFLFSAGSLSRWFGWERCVYIMLVNDKSLVNLDLILLVLFLLCFVSIY